MGHFVFTCFSCSGFSGTFKVRNSGLGPDPDFSAKNGPEKVRNWPLGLEFVEMPLVSLNIYYIYIYIHWYIQSYQGHLKTFMT